MKAIQLHVNSTKALAFVVSQHIKEQEKKNSPHDVIVREREALRGETNHGQTKKQLSKEEQTCSMRKKRSASRSDTKWTQTVSPHSGNRSCCHGFPVLLLLLKQIRNKQHNTYQPSIHQHNPSPWHFVTRSKYILRHRVMTKWRVKI
jgi:hypothetical protein